jgi:hypothetical protein
VIRANQIKIIAKVVDQNLLFCYNIDMLSSDAKHFLNSVSKL